MKILSSIINAYTYVRVKIQASKRFFGHKVDQVEARSTQWPHMKAAHAVKKIIWRVIRKNDFPFHPVDTIFRENPVKLPVHIEEPLIAKLQSPERGLKFSDGVPGEFKRDVFRQSTCLYVSDNEGNPMEYLDFKKYDQEKNTNNNSEALQKQAVQLLANFAGGHQGVVRTLSSIANQASQADTLLSLNNLVSEKLREGEKILFGGNTFTTFKISRLPDGTYQVDQEYDFQRADFFLPGGEPQEIAGVSILVKVRTQVDSEGKVTNVVPEIRGDWPGFKRGLAAGSTRQ